jgi:ribosome-associated protein
MQTFFHLKISKERKHSMQTKDLLELILVELEDLKAINTIPLDVRQLTSVTDYMIITTGNSARHVRAIAQNLVHMLKEQHVPPVGVESDTENEWILVDVGDIVVHIMQPPTRDFYNLEKLWSTIPKRLATA